MSDREPTFESVESLLADLQSHYRALQIKEKVLGWIVFGTILLGGLFLFGILESLFYLSSIIKTSLSLLLLLVALGFALGWKRQLPSLPFHDFYQQFSRSQSIPVVSDILDLHFHNSGQPALQEAAIGQGLDSLNPKIVNKKLKEFGQSHTIDQYFKSGIYGLGLTLLLTLLFTLWQPGAMQRLAQLGTSFQPPNPYNYTIHPGAITLERGQSLNPAISFKDDIPKNLSLAFKTDAEQEYRHRKAASSQEQKVSFLPLSPSSDGSYYIRMDGFKSQKYDISVQMRPRLQELSVKVIPPAYTHLDSSNYDYPFSKISAYQGSQVSIRTVTNKPVQQLQLLRSTLGDSSISLSNASDSSRFSYGWEIQQRDTVSFKMQDRSGLTNDNAFRFVASPKKDKAPFVTVDKPTKTLKMKTAEKIQLQYEAGDDFGLTGAKLHYKLERAFVNQPETKSMTLDRPQLNQKERYRWDLPDLNPKPRDVITYWISVTDNDAYNGYKTGQSREMTIRFPSTTAYMDELNSKEDSVSQSLDEVSESADQMEESYDQFKRNLRQNPETNYKQKQQLDDIKKKKDKADKQLVDLNKKFDEIRKEIEKNDALSPETMKSYQELQKLMEQIDDPELSKALEKLRKSLGEMSPRQMRKALEDYEFNEKQYKERIERTKKLFKTLKLNSDLDKLAKSLSDLSKQEKNIRQSRQSGDKKAEQQETVRKDFKKLKKKLNQLDKDPPENARKQIQELQEKSKKQMDKTDNKLEENIRQLKSQPKSAPSNSDVKNQQRDIEQRMNDMAQRMKQAKQNMQGQQMRINKQALEYVLYSLLNLSENQETLTKQTEDLPNRSEAFVEEARSQENIKQQFAMLSDSLFKLSSQVPGFSNQINKKKATLSRRLKRATNMLSERDKPNATYAQHRSLGGINKLTSMVSSLLDQLQNQQGGGGGGSMSMQQMMEQMKKMSGRQQQLNKQIQQMINDMQGEKLSQDKMERLNQLSRQQNKIRKQLKELQRNGAFESGDRVLSKLQRMSEKMEDAINDMRGGQTGGQLMERQKNILSRMLSAQKAVQKRGKEKRRTGTTAEEHPQKTPPNLTVEELQKRIRKMLNDPDYTKLTDDYQELVEQYFELLEKREKGEVE